jgi:PST family polysaccharide transporter
MLLVLAVLSLARPVFGAIASVVLIETGPRLLAAIEWLSLALLLICLVTFGRISPLWACAAVGTTYMARTAAVFLVARASCGIRLSPLLKRLAPPLLACVPMAAAMLATRAAVHRWGVRSAWLDLLTEIAIGAGVFLGAAALVSREPLQDLAALVRQRRRIVP